MTTSPPWLPIIVSQLVGHGPVLLVYLVAGVLALMNLGKHPKPAIWTLLGVGVLLFTTLAGIGSIVLFMELRLSSEMSMKQMMQLQSFTGIGLGLLRGVGMALVVAAVFSGRTVAGQPKATSPGDSPFAK